jgi:hypothetical protein
MPVDPGRELEVVIELNDSDRIRKSERGAWKI